MKEIKNLQEKRLIIARHIILKQIEPTDENIISEWNNPFSADTYMDKMQNCTECEYMRMYDYGRRIYYCDHENRIDDMGKLSIDDLPKTIPEWCPMKEKE